MSLADLFSDMESPTQKCIKAIEDGNIDKLKDSDVEEFVVKVLAPLKAKIDEVIAKPGTKILEGKASYLSKEDLQQLDMDTLSDDQATKIIAQAMAMHTGYPDQFLPFKRVTGIVHRYFSGDPDVLRRTIIEYLAAAPRYRSQAWLHDALGVGIVEQEGDRKYRRLSRKEAATKARKWILEEGQNPNAHDGSVALEVTEEEIKAEKKNLEI